MMGKTWFTEGKKKYGSIISLPQGAGYQYIREAFDRVLNYIKTLAENIILVGHVKDIMLEKNGVEVNCIELDLTGRIKRIQSSKADAIGYLYRKGKQNILSFKTTDDIACGARCAHLRDQEFVVSELKEDGTISVDWSKIYID